MPSEKIWRVYLAGEIHSQWREKLQSSVEKEGLPVVFLAPVTDHSASDNCGLEILGREEQTTWKDHVGAGINSVRTRTLVQDADIVVVRFGDRFKQWNAAFEAGFASALGKPLIIQHAPEDAHALKEVNAAAQAVAQTQDQVFQILKYVTTGKLS